MNEQNLFSKPSQCPNDLWNLIQKGLNSDSNLRPTFQEIQSECNKIITKIHKTSLLHLMMNK